MTTQCHPSQRPHSAETTKSASGAQAAAIPPPKTDEAKLLSAVREALDRNAQEIRALKEQYAKDMAEQKKKVEAQQQQIATLQQSVQAPQDAVPNTNHSA